MTIVNKAVPYDIALEEALLGALLLDREAVIKVASYLKASHFYRDRNAAIYRAIISLYERREPPDPRLVYEELRVTETTHDILVSDLVLMVDRCVVGGHSVHAEYYAERVVKYATLRRLISAGGEIAALGYEEGTDIEQTLAKASGLLSDVQAERNTQGAYSMTDMLNEWHDRMDMLDNNPEALVGIPSGFADLDGLTGGWQRSHLIVLGGRTGHGKTAAMCNMALHAASRSYRVGFFSIEMSREELIERWVSESAKVDSRKLRQGRYLSTQERARISAAMGTLSTMPIVVDDKPGISLSDLRARAYRMKVENGIDILFVDYIQKIESPRKDGNRVHEVGEVARKLKDLARELNIPVLTGAQLSRSIEARSNHVPQLADLRESGDIEHEANVVVFIYRPEMYEQDEKSIGLAELHVAKNRSGPLGTVKLRYEATITKFQPLARQGWDYEPAA